MDASTPIVYILGWRCPIATGVAHRHLSLMNMYDDPNYSHKVRDAFFQRVVPK